MQVLGEGLAHTGGRTETAVPGHPVDGQPRALQEVLCASEPLGLQPAAGSEPVLPLEAADEGARADVRVFGEPRQGDPFVESATGPLHHGPQPGGGLLGDRVGVSSAVALTVAATVICVGTTNAFPASVSRLGHALAKSGWAPAALRRTNRGGAPVLSTLTAAGIGAAGLVAAAFGWGTSDLVHVPAVLVLTTYLVSTAAGFRLLEGGQRALPAIGFVLILTVVPSAGPHLLVPVALAAAALLYRTARTRA